MSQPPVTDSVSVNLNVSLAGIDALIKQLQALVDRAINDGSRVGYFASLYTRITIALRRAILAGDFTDPEAVARLDVSFARRYLTAIEQHQLGDSRISLPWGLVLGAIDRPGLSIVQHMVLAINAHINFDLGLAAFECFGAEDLQRMRADFVKVNDLLASVVAEVESEIGLVSPIVRLIERISGSLTTRIVGFGLIEARAFAWRFAELLAEAGPLTRPRLIDRKAEEVALICGAILQDRIRNGAFAIIAAVETKDVRRVIRTFDRGLPPMLPTFEGTSESASAVSGGPAPPATGTGLPRGH